jgi:hypothetical protein
MLHAWSLELCLEILTNLKQTTLVQFSSNQHAYDNKISIEIRNDKKSISPLKTQI